MSKMTDNEAKKLAKVKADLEKAFNMVHDALLSKGFHLRKHRGSKNHPWEKSVVASTRILDSVLQDTANQRGE